MVVNKTVDRKGQIRLGRQYAGRQVAVEESKPGVWTVRLVPDNERWLHEPEVSAKLDRALTWAAAHPLCETDLEELERKILGDF